MSLYIKPIRFCHQCPDYLEKDRKWFPNGGVMAYKCRRTGNYDAFYHNEPCRQYMRGFVVFWKVVWSVLLVMTVALLLVAVLAMFG